MCSDKRFMDFSNEVLKVSKELAKAPYPKPCPEDLEFLKAKAFEITRDGCWGDRWRSVTTPGGDTYDIEVLGKADSAWLYNLFDETSEETKRITGEPIARLI